MADTAALGAAAARHGGSNPFSRTISPSKGHIQVTVVRVFRVPSALPHARLYLDDLEDISQLLSEAFPPGRTAEGANPRITYEIGDKIMDSVEDLRKECTSASSFTLRVGSRWVYADLHFYRFLNPNLHFSGFEDDVKRSLHAKIKDIFDARSSKLRNVMDGISIGTLSAVSMIVLIVSLTLPIFKGRAREFVPVGADVALAAQVIFMLMILVKALPSRVIFRYSHEQRTLSAEAKQYYWRGVFTGVIGLAAAVIAGFLLYKMTK